jgi:hypothetical protein
MGFRKSKSRLPRINGTTLVNKKRSLYQKQKGLCAACRIGEASELDHIVPIAQGGTDEDSNLHLLCTPCHRTKTAIQSGFSVRQLIGPDGFPIERGVPGALEFILPLIPSSTRSATTSSHHTARRGRGSNRDAER